MLRYIITAICYIAFYLFAMVITPLLPLFASPRMGRCGNNNYDAIEPRLPTWLSWFDTNDNSLWGDGGWREKHCVKHWKDYLGMMLWLWRNPACGFARNVCAYDIKPNETFTFTHSGNGLNVDKGKGLLGWYHIKSSTGAFYLRWCRQIFNFNKVISLEVGWELYPYINNPEAVLTEPLASFSIQPQIRSLIAK